MANTIIASFASDGGGEDPQVCALLSRGYHINFLLFLRRARRAWRGVFVDTPTQRTNAISMPTTYVPSS